MNPYDCFKRSMGLFFRNKFETNCYLSSDRQKYVIQISAFPIYQRHRRGDIFLFIPRDTFTFSSGRLTFRPLEQAHIKIYQNREGSPFIHPHIFDNGTPCLNSRCIDSARSLFVWLVQTLIYGNISKDTIGKGRPANHSLGSLPHDILDNVRNHRNYLKTELGETIVERNVGFMGKFFGDTFGDCISRP